MDHWYRPGHTLVTLARYKIGSNLSLRQGLNLRSHCPSPCCFLSLVLGSYNSLLWSFYNYSMSLTKSQYWNPFWYWTPAPILYGWLDEIVSIYNSGYTQKKTLSLQLEYWGNEPELSLRAASALNCSAISAAPLLSFAGIFFFYTLCSDYGFSNPNSSEIIPTFSSCQSTLFVSLLRKETATYRILRQSQVW